ncbi:hypothetical protein [Nocardia carnea]|uniref:hypothetical protein n=1 Tax=Nocardia carnea TaxID=37328 RepID=UPI002456B38D|nr:hypothetical protein [Nocardia carnea]
MTPDHTLARALATFRATAAGEPGAHSAALDLADAAEALLDACQRTELTPAVRASLHAILAHCRADEQRNNEHQNDKGQAGRLCAELTTAVDWLNAVTSADDTPLRASEPDTATTTATTATLTALTRVYTITGITETVTDSYIGHHRVTDKITIKTVSFTPDRLSVHYARRPAGWTWTAATVSQSAGTLDDCITFRPGQARPIPAWIGRIIAIYMPL